MRKIITYLLGFIFISHFCSGETIALKSGKTIEGKVIEQTDEYIKIDFHGVPLTFYMEDIDNTSDSVPQSSFDFESLRPAFEGAYGESSEEPKSSITNSESKAGFSSGSREKNSVKGNDFTSAMKKSNPGIYSGVQLIHAVERTQFVPKLMRFEASLGANLMSGDEATLKRIFPEWKDKDLYKKIKKEDYGKVDREIDRMMKEYFHKNLVNFFKKNERLYVSEYEVISQIKEKYPLFLKDGYILPRVVNGRIDYNDLKAQISTKYSSKGMLTMEETTVRIQELKREMESVADGLTIGDN